MYKTLLELGASPATHNTTTHEEAAVQSLSMDTEYISLQAVENDAEEERELLEAEALAAADNEDSHMDIVEEEKYEIDAYANMDKTGEITRDEQGEPYDIMLQKIGLSIGYGGYNDNM